jgi:hypothetical protein
MNDSKINGNVFVQQVATVVTWRVSVKVAIYDSAALRQAVAGIVSFMSAERILSA